MASLQVSLTYNLINKINVTGSSTSVADIYYIELYYTKPQIEHDCLPQANAFGNNDLQRKLKTEIIYSTR